MTKPLKDRPDSMKCGQCGSDFRPTNYRCRFCSEACSRSFNNNNARHQIGPCPTCGKSFLSRIKDKKFCSVRCYVKSPAFIEMARSNAKSLCPKVGTPRICFGCKAEYPRKKKTKFCTKQCRRRYMSERFDRWIANPETVALPQNYDEFLARNILSCPMDGCEWEGKFLGAHVNFTHGITAREFKKMCGFNLGSGLVGEGLSRVMSQRNARMIAEGIIDSTRGSLLPHAGERQTYMSLERKEAAKKLRAELPEFREEFTPCRKCGTVFQQPYVGRKLYCSIQCRSKTYYLKPSVEMTCGTCGKVFIGRCIQFSRFRRGLPVFCGTSCRQTANSLARKSK